MLNAHLVELSEVAYNFVSFGIIGLCFLFGIIGLCFLAVAKDFVRTIKSMEYDKDGN